MKRSDPTPTAPSAGAAAGTVAANVVVTNVGMAGYLLSRGFKLLRHDDATSRFEFEPAAAEPVKRLQQHPNANSSGIERRFLPTAVRGRRS